MVGRDRKIGRTLSAAAPRAKSQGPDERTTVSQDASAKPEDRPARILVVGDEALIEMGLCAELDHLGATAIGPAKNLGTAIRSAETEPLDGAILDLDVRGEDVYPAARILGVRDAPFIFHTGQGRSAEGGTEFPDVPVIAKPTQADVFLAAILDQDMGRENT